MEDRDKFEKKDKGNFQFKLTDGFDVASQLEDEKLLIKFFKDRERSLNDLEDAKVLYSRKYPYIADDYFDHIVKEAEMIDDDDSPRTLGSSKSRVGNLFSFRSYQTGSTFQGPQMMLKTNLLNRNPLQALQGTGGITTQLPTNPAQQIGAMPAKQNIFGKAKQLFTGPAKQRGVGSAKQLLDEEEEEEFGVPKTHKDYLKTLTSGLASEFLKQEVDFDRPNYRAASILAPQTLDPSNTYAANADARARTTQGAANYADPMVAAQMQASANAQSAEGVRRFDSEQQGRIGSEKVRVAGQMDAEAQRLNDYQNAIGDMKNQERLAEAQDQAASTGAFATLGLQGVFDDFQTEQDMAMNSNIQGQMAQASIQDEASKLMAKIQTEQPELYEKNRELENQIIQETDPTKLAALKSQKLQLDAQFKALYKDDYTAMDRLSKQLSMGANYMGNVGWTGLGNQQYGDYLSMKKGGKVKEKSKKDSKLSREKHTLDKQKFEFKKKESNTKAFNKIIEDSLKRSGKHNESQEKRKWKLLDKLYKL